MLKRAGSEKGAAEAVALENAKQADEARRARARRLQAQQLIIPSEEEDAAITAAALSDPDAQPLSDRQLARLRPARRGRGRPVQEVTKVPTSIRFDIEVLDSFKALGDGWQTRMNDVLRTYLIENKQLARRYHATVQVPGNELQKAGEFLVVALNDREAVRKVRQHLRDAGWDDEARSEVYAVDMGSAVIRELPLIV